MWWNLDGVGYVVLTAILIMAAGSIVCLWQARGTLCVAAAELDSINPNAGYSTRDEAAKHLAPQISQAHYLLHSSLYEGYEPLDQNPFYGLIHWPRYFAGVFVFIGLIGTIWGIAYAVTNLGATVQATSQVGQSGATTTGGSFSVDSWKRLLEGVTQLLTGMRSAFVCTLAGLGATAIVSLLNAWFISAADSLMLRVRNVADKLTIPLWRAQQTSVKFDNLVTVTTDLKSCIALLQTTASTLSHEINSAQHALPTLAREAKVTADALSGAATGVKNEFAAVTQGYQKLKLDIDSAGQILVQDCQTLRDSARELKEAVGLLIQEREGLAYVGGMVGSSARNLDESATRLADLLGETNEKRRQEMDNLAVRVTATCAQLEGLATSFDSGLRGANKSLQTTFADLAKDVKNALDSLGKTIEDQRSATLRDTNSTLAALKAALDRHAEVVDASLKSVSQREPNPSQGVVITRSADGHGHLPSAGATLGVSQYTPADYVAPVYSPPQTRYDTPPAATTPTRITAAHQPPKTPRRGILGRLFGKKP